MPFYTSYRIQIINILLTCTKIETETIGNAGGLSCNSK